MGLRLRLVRVGDLVLLLFVRTSGRLCHCVVVVCVVVSSVVWCRCCVCWPCGKPRPVQRVSPLVAWWVQPVPSQVVHTDAPASWLVVGAVMRVCASLLPLFAVCLCWSPLVVMPCTFRVCVVHTLLLASSCPDAFHSCKGMRGLPSSPSVIPAQCNPVRGHGLYSVVRSVPQAQ
jgi:hypothetical protein